MIFNKITVIIVSLLLLVSVSSGFYIKYLKELNNSLRVDNKIKTEQLKVMENEIENQRIRFERTLKTLELRERKLKNIEDNNNNLKRRLQDIAKNENDKCINSTHSESISNLLQSNNEISSETNSSVSP